MHRALWTTSLTCWNAMTQCTRHNYVDLYSTEFQSQNPFRFRSYCQSVKVITFSLYKLNVINTQELNKRKVWWDWNSGKQRNLSLFLDSPRYAIAGKLLKYCWEFWSLEKKLILYKSLVSESLQTNWNPCRAGTSLASPSLSFSAHCHIKRSLFYLVFNLYICFFSFFARERAW